MAIEAIDGLVIASALSRQVVGAGLEPDPILTVSEHADRYRMLSQKSSPEPGKWRTERTPYLREIMDCLSTHSHIWKVVFMKGSQIGATECGNNFLGYVVHHAPGPLLYVLDTVQTARKASRHRVAPMIADCPELRALVSKVKRTGEENTVLMKEFPGGYMALTGANSASGLRHVSARYLFLDEIDDYPMDVSGQGNPVELAFKRTANYEAIRKIYLCSTPTVKEVSRIENAFEETDKRYFEVPCPFCGVFQVIAWDRIRFDPTDLDKGAHLECCECNKLITEGCKTDMLANGRWMPTIEGPPGVRGYHLSSLYSPLGWYSWESAARDFLKSKRRGPETLKVWINNCLGETWEEEGQKLDAEEVADRCETFPARVPRKVLLLTAGVDVQDNRLEIEVVGWGLEEESWGIEYNVIYGDPGKRELWDTLDEYLRQRFEHADGYALPISCTCIDSGGHYTQAVYRYCKGRAMQRQFAIKGVGGPGKPIVGASRKGRSGKGRRHCDLFLVGADQARGIIYSRIRLEESGPGYCHYQMEHGYTPEYFQGLTSMKAVLHYRRGIPHREWHLLPNRRKEPFDCRIYALAALYILNPVWSAIAKRRERARTSSTEGGGQEAATPTPTPRRRPRRKSGWMSRWKH
jgi:phage terminase large subunit GpA-like protein